MSTFSSKLPFYSTSMLRLFPTQHEKSDKLLTSYLPAYFLECTAFVNGREKLPLRFQNEKTFCKSYLDKAHNVNFITLFSTGCGNSNLTIKPLRVNKGSLIDDHFYTLLKPKLVLDSVGILLAFSRHYFSRVILQYY